MNSEKNRYEQHPSRVFPLILTLGVFCLGGFGCASGGGGATHPAVPPPSVGVSKNQAWKDAEALAALDPSRLTVIGSGESMKPVYGENTVLVLQKVAFAGLAEGMNVAYRNHEGRVVLHRLISRDGTRSWRVRGLNNESEDRERVTPENLLGIVYAAFANDQVR